MIHYHGNPISGPKDVMTRFWTGRHAMVSFAYPEHLPLIAECCQSFALDNGAFTTWKGGKEFDHDAYAEWVCEWSRHPAFAWCLIPDVIGGTAEENHKLVCRWKTDARTYRTPSVPVWHFHEPADLLASYAARFELVALGSSGAWPTPGTDGWWERLGECLPRILDERGRPVCKLHGLRMMHPDVFRHLPLHSADSTNAAQNGGSVTRFGSYPPLEAWQRANVIADRIEAFSSAPAYQRERLGILFP